MTIEALTAECKEIQALLEEPYDNEVAVMSARLTQVNVYLARTAEILSLSKQLQDKAVKAAFAAHMDAIMGMTPSISKIFVNSYTDEENRLVTWADRLNAALVPQGDNMRTQISLEKQMLDLSRKGY